MKCLQLTSTIQLMLISALVSTDAVKSSPSPVSSQSNFSTARSSLLKQTWVNNKTSYPSMRGGVPLAQVPSQNQHKQNYYLDSVYKNLKPWGILRGGSACSDSDLALFSKIGLTIVAQAAALAGFLFLPTGLLSSPPTFLPDSLFGSSSILAAKIFGLPVLQWISFLLVVFASSFIGTLIDGAASAASAQVLSPNVTPGDPDWYSNLKRPRWEPPGWVFPIMWLIVSKPTQFLALATLWKNDKLLLSVASRSDLETPKPNIDVIQAIVTYCLHLSLGDAWNKVFFGHQCPGRGAAVITAFLGVLALSARLFYGLDSKAGLFLLPTCAWVSVATALNWNIYLNNQSIGC